MPKTLAICVITAFLTFSLVGHAQAGERSAGLGAAAQMIERVLEKFASWFPGAWEVAPDNSVSKHYAVPDPSGISAPPEDDDEGLQLDDSTDPAGGA